MPAEFDRVGDRYEELVDRSIAFSGRRHSFFLEAKARALLGMIVRRVAVPREVRALDVGCGNGMLHDFLGELGSLDAVDPSEALVAEARKRHPGVRYAAADGTELPFADGAFDVAFAVCVLHHVETARRSNFVGELVRVTRPGGLVVVFEHNPLNPLTRLAVSRCAFDEDAALLGRRATGGLLRAAGARPVEGRYILFFPWGGRPFAAAERVLAPVPVGAQYYVAAGV